MTGTTRPCTPHHTLLLPSVSCCEPLPLHGSLTPRPCLLCGDFLSTLASASMWSFPLDHCTGSRFAYKTPFASQEPGELGHGFFLSDVLGTGRPLPGVDWMRIQLLRCPVLRLKHQSGNWWFLSCHGPADQDRGSISVLGPGESHPALGVEVAQVTCAGK